jgi:hypothetical protein
MQKGLSEEDQVLVNDGQEDGQGDFVPVRGAIVRKDCCEKEA